MLDRGQAMRVTKLAAEIFQSSQARQRIEQGYTRVDPFLIAAREGISVLLRPMDRLLGAFLRDGSPGILINEQRSAGLIHMTCAHELGHFFLGHGNQADEKIDYELNANYRELEADWFAYHLLAPRYVIAQVLKRKGWQLETLKQPARMYQLSLRLGISYSAIIWSLYRQNLITIADTKTLLQVAPADIKRQLLGAQLLNPTREVWVLDESDRSSILEPRPNDQIVFRLESHAAAGYLWSVDGAASEGFQISPITSKPTDEDTSIENLEFGSNVTLDYLVSRHSSGDASAPATLQLAERKQWSSQSPAQATYEAQTHFEALGTGLSEATKRRLLESIKE